MIPKVLHFIWMPGLAAMPGRYRQCFDSWWGFHSPVEWDIKLWTRRNLEGWVENAWAFDLHHPSVQSDVFRMEVVRRFGGVYVDCDMQCVAPIDELLNVEAFTSMRNERVLEPSGFGATPGHPWLDDVLREVNELRGRGGFNTGLDVDGPYERATDRHPEVERVPYDRLQVRSAAVGEIGFWSHVMAIHHRFAEWRGQGVRAASA